MDYFAKAGFPIPPLSNPADHILDVITPSPKQEDEEVPVLSTGEDDETKKDDGITKIGRAHV